MELSACLLESWNAVNEAYGIWSACLLGELRLPRWPSENSRRTATQNVQKKGIWDAEKSEIKAYYRFNCGNWVYHIFSLCCMYPGWCLLVSRNISLLIQIFAFGSPLPTPMINRPGTGVLLLTVETSRQRWKHLISQVHRFLIVRSNKLTDTKTLSMWVWHQ
jgi:hypothetical protein